MDKITLANALKAVFGTSITPTSSQYVPITASDGTPAGISSMSDLASVLGVNVNNIEAKTSDGYPINAWSVIGKLRSIDGRYGVDLLIAEDSGNANTLYIRTILNGQEKTWKSIPLT